MPSQFKNETANYSDFVNANKVLRKIKENPMTMNSLSWKLTKCCIRLLVMPH